VYSSKRSNRRDARSSLRGLVRHQELAELNVELGVGSRRFSLPAVRRTGWLGTKRGCSLCPKYCLLPPRRTWHGIQLLFSGPCKGADMASSWRGLGSITGPVCEPCVRDVRIKGDETRQLGHLIPTRTWSLPVVLGRQWPVTVVGGGVFCVLGEGAFFDFLNRHPRHPLSSEL